MKKNILTQGHLDGFCLLYSIMNSYKALIKPNQSATVFSSENTRKWQKIIGITPSLHNFASGEGSEFGVDKNKTDIELKERFIHDCFFVLTEGMKKNISSRREKLENILETDFSKSTIILCVNKSAQFKYGSVGDHWVSLVGIDKDNSELLVCCSYTYLEENNPEQIDIETGRTFNNTFHFSQLKKSKIYINSIHKITVRCA